MLMVVVCLIVIVFFAAVLVTRITMRFFYYPFLSKAYIFSNYLRTPTTFYDSKCFSQLFYFIIFLFLFFSIQEMSSSLFKRKPGGKIHFHFMACFMCIKLIATPTQLVCMCVYQKHFSVESDERSK